MDDAMVHGVDCLSECTHIRYNYKKEGMRKLSLRFSPLSFFFLVHYAPDWTHWVRQ
jgi:hypothetical protein